MVTSQDKLEYTKLDNEDKDAWKHFKKQDRMKEALENCKDPESRLKESAIYANQMFQKKNYKEAAKFYA